MSPRQLAIANGAKTYHGKPCKKCGGTERTAPKGECIPCKVEYHRRYWQANNDHLTACCRQWRKDNIESARELNRLYALKYPERVAAKAAKRRAAKLQRTPSWSEGDLIKRVYAEAAKRDCHVDHVIPLQGELVSGLHVWANLQLLPPEVNLSKSNQFNPSEW